MKKELLEEKIQDLIDGKLSSEERSSIEKEIQKNEHLKLYYSTLMEVHHSLNHVELIHPSAQFTDIVMQSLHRPRQQFFDYRSILLFIGILICAALGLIYSSQVQMDIPELAPVSSELLAPILDDVKFSLPGVNLPPAPLMLNVFYFILLFTALIYFDRVILKQLFRSDRYTV